MKTASMPSLRVASQLRESAEAVLREGETLSAFMEQSLRDEVARRQNQREFLARGLAARDEARRTGRYVDSAKVHAQLRGLLAKARKAAR